MVIKNFVFDTFIKKKPKSLKMSLCCPWSWNCSEVICHSHRREGGITDMWNISCDSSCVSSLLCRDGGLVSIQCIASIDVVNAHTATVQRSWNRGGGHNSLPGGMEGVQRQHRLCWSLSAQSCCCMSSYPSRRLFSTSTLFLHPCETFPLRTQDALHGQCDGCTPASWQSQRADITHLFLWKQKSLDYLSFYSYASCWLALPGTRHQPVSCVSTDSCHGAPVPWNHFLRGQCSGLSGYYAVSPPALPS